MPPVFPFAGGLNGDEPIPDRDYEDLFFEDSMDWLDEEDDEYDYDERY